jgi:hypothetical protein
MRAVVLATLWLAACGAPAPEKGEAPQLPPPIAPAPAPIDLSQLEGRLVGVGRNPEWRLDADAQLGMVLTLPAQGLTFSADFVAPQRADDGGARIASAPLTFVLNAGPCIVDGVTYPMRASAQVEQGEPLVGCGFVRWDWRLVELLPAIDACIAQSPQTRRITYAAAEGDGRVLVRMQGPQLAPVDCHAPLANGGPVLVAPTDSNLRIGGDGDAIFVRAPGENPGGECYEAPEVRAADGALLGWMDDPLGC